VLTRGIGGALAILAAGCGTQATAPEFHGLVLCSDDPQRKSVLTIDSEALFGLADDVGRPISRCEASNASCITFPIIFSAPPKMPADSMEAVVWSVGGSDFSLQLLPGSSDTYSISVKPAPKRQDGSSPHLAGTYTYSEQQGILTLRLLGDRPDGWVRCAGRLTFEDLNELTRRLP
jgi:hypothetical protein